MVCKYCNIETNLLGGAHSNHVSWCHSNPKREERAKALEKVRAARLGKPGTNQYIKAKREGRTVEISQEVREKISKAGTGRLHSEETKRQLSEMRKKWLKDHPEEHPWKRREKFQSIPCNHLKNCLRDEGLTFEEEYSPIQDRAYSLDIAFPTNKLAIEINGEQHYDRKGNLKPYYQERHNLIVDSGWTVLEVHYARCFGTYLSETIALIKSYLH